MTYAENLFWEKYKDLMIEGSQKSEDLEKKFVQYSALVDENQKISSILKTILRNIPIGIALRYWLNTISSQSKQKKISQHMVQLIERKILSIQDQKGQLLCLDYFQEQGEQEHKRIIEDIKCILDWPNLIKEELVQHYIEFSQHLHQNTFGIIPIAQDPDRLHASQKVVNYDDFTRFVQFLSERDALIAKLLYFGGPTVEEVLFLKYGQLDFDNCSVNFSKQSVSYPKHLILELSNFAGKKKKNALVFLNYKGKQVVRTHLNHSFGRASKEINLMITPRELTKIKLK